MKKHVLTVVFVLGLSAAVAFAQAGAGAAGSAQSGSPGNYPAGAGANNPDQMGQQSAPMSEQQPGTKDRDKDRDRDKENKKSSSMANVDDESLHRQVHEQLASNPDLQNVQITVKDGVVTLDGSVPKKEDRKEAKKLAKSVPGVKGVKEHLTVNASASAAAPSTTGGISGQTAATGTTTEPSSQASTGAVAGQAGATSSTTGTTTGAATSTEMGQTGAAAGTQTGAATGMGQTSAGSTAATTASPCSSLSSQAGVSGGASTQTGAAGAATSGDLASQIQSEICKDPTLASSNISVSQQGNQIILSGTVPSTDVKDKASDIAMKFATGMSLVNNIQVSGQAGTPPSTAGGVSGAVGGTANPSAPATTEQPAISGQAGASTSGAQPPSVSGQAGAGAQTPESGAAAGAQAGATGAQAGTTMSTGDDQLRTQIETALRQEPTLSNDNINVNLTADQVELSGTVANGKDRQTAKRIAESFAGNRKVVDHLTVTGEGKSNVPPPEEKK